MSGKEPPVLTISEVAELLGSGVKPKTVSQYLLESRAEIGKTVKRKGRYADHPFPEPDGRIGRAPWWLPSRRTEILTWAAERPGQGVGGGRPRSSE
jgi:hypothetical protein